MIVVDASAVVEMLLGGARGRRAEETLLERDERAQAPALLDPEVVQALRRLAAAGVVTDARARAAVAILGELPVTRHVMTPLLPRLWELRRVMTAYDAAYVALAEALECPLLTFDEALARTSGHRARVLVP